MPQDNNGEHNVSIRQNLAAHGVARPTALQRRLYSRHDQSLSQIADIVFSMFRIYIFMYIYITINIYIYMYIDACQCEPVYIILTYTICEVYIYDMLKHTYIYIYILPVYIYIYTNIVLHIYIYKYISPAGDDPRNTISLRDQQEGQICQEANDRLAG